MVMKKIIFTLIASTGLLFANTANAANAAGRIATVTVMLAQQQNEPDKKTQPSKGHRMPAYTICTVDFTTGTIESNTRDAVATYELWDAEGECMLVSFVSDHELVGYMSGISGAYQLRLVTEEYIYIGYIEL